MIREANLNDAKAIVLINIRCWQQAYKDIFPKEFLSKLDPNDKTNIDKCKEKITQYVVYEIDKKIVGFARFGKNKKNYDDNYGEIYAIYIDSSYQKQKIGTKLIEYVFSKLKKNYKYVLISTLKENSANEFYRKIGGELIGTCKFTLESKEYEENIYKYIINEK